MVRVPFAPAAVCRWCRVGLQRQGACAWAMSWLCQVAFREVIARNPVTNNLVWSRKIPANTTVTITVRCPHPLLCCRLGGSADQVLWSLLVVVGGAASWSTRLRWRLAFSTACSDRCSSSSSNIVERGVLLIASSCACPCSPARESVCVGVFLCFVFCVLCFVFCVSDCVSV